MHINDIFRLVREKENLPCYQRYCKKIAQNAIEIDEFRFSFQKINQNACGRSLK